MWEFANNNPGYFFLCVCIAGAALTSCFWAVASAFAKKNLSGEDTGDTGVEP